MKTLWSGASHPAGTHTAAWDGTDDFGNLVPDGAYVIRVLSNACTYTWEGVLGNTSASFTGPAVWKSYQPIGGMAVSGTTAYYGNGYAEAGSTSGKFTTSSPNSTKQLILGKGADVWNVATDGTLVYWSGQDPNAPANTFVFGTRVSDDQEFAFSSGVPYTVLYGFAHSKVIDKRTDGSPASGLAVQRTGSLLFVSHADKNQIAVLNKTTGALVRTITNITAPGALAVDGADNLWMVRKNGAVWEVAQYSVAANGTLTQLRVAAGTFDTPMALGISPDNSTLVVVDGGSSQQLKAFTVSTGASSWTFGQAGGYTVSPTVSNDRFMFEKHAFVAFQPDGSFWVGDYGNGRIQRYTAARVFIDRVQYRPKSYFCAVDENNPTRVFSDFLEFAVDYSLPLAPANGSWSLVRNWTKMVPAGFGAGEYRRIYPCTLGNGRTYALLQRDSDRKEVLFEMTAAGQFRDTGVVTATPYAGWQPDGSIRTVNAPAVGGTVTWTKASLTGFDASQNPVYGPAATLAAAPAAGSDPVWWGDENHIRPGVQTSGGIVISFDHQPPDAAGTRGTGYHLGGVRVGGTGWLWRTSMATHLRYEGPWPEDGAFDVGNGVLTAGSVPMTVGPHVFYGYYGESYRGSQVNKYRHYYENGLFVGEFGEVGDNVGNNAGGLQCPAKMAGNALNPWIVRLPDGRAFLYHNDESWHGGVHRWRIDGLDTVAEQQIPIAWTAPTVAGLRAEYFDTGELDNTALKTVRTDGTVNFNWGTTIPAGTALTAADTWSARWSGFVTPPSTQTYTFYTNTDDGARLWVNGQLVIDRWTNTGSEQSGSIALSAGQRYAIKLEYFQATGSAAASLSWAAAGLAKQVIPQSQLSWCPWLHAVPGAGSVSLLAGQPLESTVLNGTYGVTRVTATDTTDDYSNRWIVRTGKFTYRAAGGPNDLSFFFNNNTNSTRQVTLNLGMPSDAITQWTLAASLTYDINNPNHDTLGGQYLEVLDDAGRVIARFYPRQVTPGTDYRITANAQTVFQGDQTAFSAVVNQWQPLSIYAANGNITFGYAGRAPVTTGLFDPAANWRRAKTLRFHYWSIGPSGGYGRAAAVRNVTFTAVPSTTSMPELKFGTCALSGGNGDGLLDRNEHNNLTVTLANVGTGSATGLAAVLTTSTAGVTVLQPQAFFADLEPGLSGTNAVAFELDTAPDIPAGTAAVFILAVNHAGGSSNITFTLPPTTGALGNGRIDSDSDGIADWWTLQNFGHRTALGSDGSRALDIPHADGAANLLKYALGLTAQTRGLQSRLSHGTTTALGQRYYFLSYTRPDPPPTGLSYAVESSDILDPLTWSGAGTVEVGNAVSGGLRTITVRTGTPLDTTLRQFLRLKVTTQ